MRKGLPKYVSIGNSVCTSYSGPAALKTLNIKLIELVIEIFHSYRIGCAFCEDIVRALNKILLQ